MATATDTYTACLEDFIRLYNEVSESVKMLEEAKALLRSTLKAGAKVDLEVDGAKYILENRASEKIVLEREEDIQKALEAEQKGAYLLCLETKLSADKIRGLMKVHKALETSIPKTTVTEICVTRVK